MTDPSPYTDLGLRPALNASGPLTALGNALPAPEVLAAMTAAAREFVPYAELQQAASRVIAEVTGAEAGYVTNGSAGGMTLAMAACLAGRDLMRIDALPDTAGFRDRVIVFASHRGPYDHALRAAGARVLTVADTLAALTDAISDQVVAVFMDATGYPGKDGADVPPLAEVIAVAHRAGLPVIVDAAMALPPVANLRAFVAAGADIVAFSGGKAIGALPATGFVAGRADLIASVALQHQDHDTAQELSPTRQPYFLRHPHLVMGLGRGLKVGREGIVALLVALRRYAAADHDSLMARDLDWLGRLRKALQQMDWLAVSGLHLDPPDGSAPALLVALAEGTPGAGPMGDTMGRCVARLREGDPAIMVSEYGGELMITPSCLPNDRRDVVLQRLVAELGLSRPMGVVG